MNQLTIKPFAFLFITSCLTATAYSFTISDGYKFDYKGKSVSKVDSGLLSPEVKTIEIDNRFGDVKVQTVQGDGNWTWEGKCWATEKEDAETFLTELVLTVEESEQSDGSTRKKWSLTMPDQDSKLRGVKSNLTINVSPDVAVIVNNPHGNQMVKGVAGGATLSAEHGDIDISNVSGAIVVNNRHGKVVASQLNGNTELDCEHSDIKLKGASRSIDLKCRHTDVVVTDALGEISVDNEYGDMQIESAGKTVSCTSKYGDVIITMNNKDFASITADAKHGDVDVYLLKGTKPIVQLETEYGDKDSAFQNSDSPNAPTVVLKGKHSDVKVRDH